MKTKINIFSASILVITISLTKLSSHVNFPGKILISDVSGNLRNGSHFVRSIKSRDYGGLIKQFK